MRSRVSRTTSSTPRKRSGLDVYTTPRYFAVGTLHVIFAGKIHLSAECSRRAVRAQRRVREGEWKEVASVAEDNLQRQCMTDEKTTAEPSTLTPLDHIP
jgi:hypothetical protein